MANEQASAEFGPKWFQRLSSIIFVLFCFELGLFLIVYPWIEAWGENYFASALRWREIWNSPYIRGGVSGLCLVNVYIAITEVFKMFRGRN